MEEKKKSSSTAQKDMVTITVQQLESLLKHDTNALAQLKALQNTGLVGTCGVARADILRLIQKAEKESTSEEVTVIHDVVYELYRSPSSVH